MYVFITIILAIGIIISIYLRRKQNMWRNIDNNPLAKAITQLVGTAGGIYISLELLLNFLGIPTEIWNPPSLYFIKPLAIFSLTVAIIQPWGQKMWADIRKRRKI